jgi:hypothetical protein
MAGSMRPAATECQRRQATLFKLWRRPDRIGSAILSVGAAAGQPDCGPFRARSLLCDGQHWRRKWPQVP